MYVGKYMLPSSRCEAICLSLHELRRTPLQNFINTLLVTVRLEYVSYMPPATHYLTKNNLPSEKP